MTNHPLHDQAMAIRYDLTAAQSKLTELVRQIALLDPTVTTACTHCGYRPAPGMPSLAEHDHRHHDGPPPPEPATDE